MAEVKNIAFCTPVCARKFSPESRWVAAPQLAGARRSLPLPFALLFCFLFLPRTAPAHPMGNFSVSHYAGIRLERDFIELRYLIDMAEIPTFQEMQQAGIRAQASDSHLDGYLAQKAAALMQGLVLEVSGRPLSLQLVSQNVIFPPGAGGLPTMKLGFLFRASLADAAPDGVNQLHYRDNNFPERAGWKEIVPEVGSGVSIVRSSVSGQDRSHGLTNYPTDLLNSPPQDVEASLSFTVSGVRSLESGVGGQKAEGRGHELGVRRPESGGQGGEITGSPNPSPNPKSKIENEKPLAPNPESQARNPVLSLEANKQETPRNAFTELMTTQHLGFWFLLTAALIAAGLGAFHALEPGHGKTIVAAYLMGSHGTATHAFLLGLIVTFTHTGGVYLLGLITLYASRYVVPDRLYPWLGVVSGMTIVGMGVYLFVRRWAGHDHGHSPEHGHSHHHGPFGHAHDHGADQESSRKHGHEHSHEHGHVHDAGHAQERQRSHVHLGARDAGVGVREHNHELAPFVNSEFQIKNSRWESMDPERRTLEAEEGSALELENPKSEIQNPESEVSYRELVALGVTGGIVPCPAALVVLLSAVTLHRVALGLFLIAAFSVGLAAVLIAVGLLMVFASRFMSHWNGEGPFITRWLPMASASVITILGLAITVRALITTGLLQIGI